MKGNTINSAVIEETRKALTDVVKLPKTAQIKIAYIIEGAKLVSEENPEKSC